MSEVLNQEEGLDKVKASEKYTEDNIVLLHDKTEEELEERILVDLNNLDNLKEEKVSMLDILTSEGENE